MPAYSFGKKPIEKEKDATPGASEYQQFHNTISERMHRGNSEKIKQEKYRHYLDKQRERMRKRREEWIEEEKEKEQELYSPIETGLTEQLQTQTISGEESVESTIEDEFDTTKQLEKVIKRNSIIPPGPGRYDIAREFQDHKENIKKNHRAISFGYHKIDYVPMKREKDSGPGPYIEDRPFDGPRFSLREKPDSYPVDFSQIQRRRSLLNREVSQPEYIDPPNYMGKSPGTKFSPRAKPPRELNISVGPGSYTPNIDNASPKYSILGRKYRKMAYPPLPGPADYSVEEAERSLLPENGRTISVVVPRLKNDTKLVFPGPWSYTPQYKSSISGVVIKDNVGDPLRPKSRPKVRERIVKEEKKLPTLKTTFGLSERSEIVSASLSPAPHEYQHIEIPIKRKCRRGAECERCSFGLKTDKLILPNYNPGPGTYNIDEKCSIPITFGKDIRKQIRTNSYTDQFYDIPNLFPSPKIKFSKAEKCISLKKSTLPGPTTYNIKSSVGQIPAYLL